MNENSVKVKKKRLRSPAYPSIDLETAIQRAREFKNHGGSTDFFVPVKDALESWGLASKSSAGMSILAALGYFGLIEDQGFKDKREVKLSNLAQTILFYENDSKEYMVAIQQAALKPGIHKELWEEFNNQIPPQGALRAYLVMKREGARFTESAANDLIEEFSKTISFANLLKIDSISGRSEDKNQQSEEKQMQTMPDTQKIQADSYASLEQEAKGQLINFPIKISEKMTANLQIQLPIDKEGLREFLTAIEALKPGILQSVLDEQEKEN